MLLYFCLTALFAQQDDLIVTTKYWENGKIKSLTYSDGTYNQGVWQYFDSLGRLSQEDKYINGHNYYLNKWIDTEQVIKNGYGTIDEYYDNGHLKASGQVQEGKKYGLWTAYYENGNKQNVLTYTDWLGKHQNDIEYQFNLITSYDTAGETCGRHGSGALYITNNQGVITEKIIYTNNLKDSTYTYYENGFIHNIKVTDNVNNVDRLIRSFYPTGIKEYEEMISGDTIIRTEWHGNGKLRQIKKMTDFTEVSIIYNAKGEKAKLIECTLTYALNEQFEEYMAYDCNERDLLLEEK